MAFRFRKTKKIGGLNVTTSGSGIGVSFGKGPIRVSRSATGRIQATIKTPIKGANFTVSGSTIANVIGGLLGVAGKSASKTSKRGKQQRGGGAGQGDSFGF